MTNDSRMGEFFEAKDVQLYSRGDVLHGRVVQVNEQIILVDIGYKSEAQLRPQELAPFRQGRIEAGEELEVIITYIDEEEGTIYVSEKQAIYEKWIGELERHYKTGEPVLGVVESVVRDAGYNVNLKGIRAFLPGSHLGGDLPPDIEKLRGREISLKILELNRREKNLVVSHKEYLRDLERKRLEEIFSKIKIGDLVEGQIKSIVDFGLFVDVGGFEGLVHRSEISWKDLPAPPNTYKVGDRVKVKILNVEKEKQRISLSIKQTRPDPWLGIAARYPKDNRVQGTVVAITDFGAFVRLEEDVEGLVHVSELSWGFPENPREVVNEGDRVDVVILDVDEAQRRISLSMRRAQPDPWESIERKYPEGSVVSGRVTKLLDFGAFVQLEEGVEALLHISEMSWERVTHPNEVLSEGDEVTVKVIKCDSQRRKIRLSLREMKEDPWHRFVEEYPVGTAVDGVITELKDFGAFCRITDEVEGLIHVSEISHERINRPADVLHAGDRVQARIIGINEEKRQVRLSLRNVDAKLQEPELSPQQTSEDAGHEALTLREHLKGKGLV
jgi:small subunit ribosomal protein S1